MKVLGIESSCDETAAAVVEDGYMLLSNVVASSMDLHVQYGGVVPEIAARSHIEVIDGVIQGALDEAGCAWEDIDAIAVTYGAGLGGSLLIGVMTARTLAIVHDKPLYAINHVEAHVYANFLTSVASQEARAHSASGERREPGVEQGRHERSKVSPEEGRVPPESMTTSPSVSNYHLPNQQPTFPALALIVSGGHSQLVLFRDHFDYTLLGQTHDDAIGEAFDKVAKIIGLPYPGGPSVSQKATEGNPHAFSFPKAKMAGAYDFSFSGLKTAVLRTAQEQIGEDFTFPSKNIAARLSAQQQADIAASFQRVAIETVVDKAIKAFEEFAPASVVIAGGVAANQELRRQLAQRLPISVEYTDIRLCTDNGAMVATLGCFHMKLGRPASDPYSLEISPNLSM